MKYSWGQPGATVAFAVGELSAEERKHGSVLVGESLQLMNHALTTLGLTKYMHSYLYLEEWTPNTLNENTNVLVPLDETAFTTLTGRSGVTKWVGSVIWSPEWDRKIIPTFHPLTWSRNAQFRNPLAYMNFRYFLIDLKRIYTEAQTREYVENPYRAITNPTYTQVMEFLHTCHREGYLGATVAYDIELVPRTYELSCIGLSYTPDEAICIPFCDSKGHTFSAEQEQRIWELLAQIFEEEKILKIGQNVIFDTHLLLKNYGIEVRNLQDTMVAQALLFPESRKALEYITHMWTTLPYYKDDGKVWMREGLTGWPQLWHYNCLDVLSCAQAHPHQQHALTKQKNATTFYNVCDLIEPLAHMMERGIKIDTTTMDHARKSCLEEASTLEKDLKEVMGDININSSAQIKKYFYETLKLTPYKHLKTGKPTVDELALQRIAARGFSEASKILQQRGLVKLASTFLDSKNIDPDGRMRCSYNPVGTKFGRISSSTSIFGTGMNLQNVPHTVLTHFVADEGYIIYSLDMSQIENREVAYIGGITPLIQAFESGRDAHRTTAQLVLSQLGTSKAYEEITPEERQNLGKRVNHAFNYGFGPNAFSIRYEVPLSAAKRIYHAYHTAYPGVKGKFWRHVRDSIAQYHYVKNLLGRVIPFHGLMTEGRFRAAYSAIPQSTCGDLINRYGINFLYYNDNALMKQAVLLTQVHDSLEIEVPLALSWYEHAQILCTLRDSLSQPLTFGTYTFSVPVDLTVNYCLNKERGVEVKNLTFMQLTPGSLPQVLQESYETLQEKRTHE